jgi:hypothetical protein
VEGGGMSGKQDSSWIIFVRIFVVALFSFGASVLTTATVFFFWFHWYMASQGMQDRSELSEDYGFAMFTIAVVTVTFFCSLLASLWYFSSVFRKHND